MKPLEKLKESKEIIEQFMELDEESLEGYYKEVKGLSSGLKHLKKAFRSIELRDKKVKVKEDSTWIYKGHTFKIIEVYMIQSGKWGVYEKGSMDLRLDLRGTEFEFRNNSRQTSTVINTKDLIFV